MGRKSINPSPSDDQKKMQLEHEALEQAVPDAINRLKLLEGEQLEFSELELSKRMDQLNLLGKEFQNLRGRLNRLERLEQNLLK